jgi:hypothetical protein
MRALAFMHCDMAAPLGINKSTLWEEISLVKNSHYLLQQRIVLTRPCYFSS